MMIIEDLLQEDHEVVHLSIVLDMQFHLCREIILLEEDIMTFLALANRMQEMYHIHDIVHHHRHTRTEEVVTLITTVLRDLDHLTFRKGIMEEDMRGDHLHHQRFMMLGIENLGTERLWDLLLRGRTHPVVRDRLGGCLVVEEDIEHGFR